MDAAIGLENANTAPDEPEITGDADLVRRVASGETARFADLMQRYSPVVLGFLYGRVRSEADREDVLQEVFLEAFRQIARLRRPERFGPWLMRISRSKLLDYYRQRQRRSGREAELGDDPDDDPIDPAPGPRDLLSESELQRRVRDAIGRMRDRYRTVLYLRLIAEEEPQAIARRLGLKESTVRMRLMRGLEQLRNRLVHEE
ncbi:sigma-70 family RNA polymerase sigma factor [bacterium]|nr:sigma-70 family RNA polymerase sigma factor [bacterium]